MDKVVINKLKEEGVLTYTDVHFARLMEETSEKNDALFLAAALASSQARFGHICLDIENVEGKLLFTSEDSDERVKCPDKQEWLEVLNSSSVIGRPGEYKPLILEDEKRLYLYRYWDYQQKLAEFIREKTRQNFEFEASEKSALGESLKRLFPNSGTSEMDWQKIAACISLLKKMSVISGGPGTGKTTTITKILALLIESGLSQKKERIKIALAAPTGKAAARLSDSISDAKIAIDCPENIKELIPDDASTIHRLLGSVSNSPYFRYNEKRKLPVDIVIIDEASMVDLALMSKLTSAIPDNARLILLGDQDQLASVEAGAVLGDICNTGNNLAYSEVLRNGIEELSGEVISEQPGDSLVSDIGDAIVVLRKSYRFGDDSGIKTVSLAVNDGNDDLFYDIVNSGKFTDFLSGELPSGIDFEIMVKEYALKHFGSVFHEESIEGKLNQFDKFRLLCAVRKGAYGVENLNLLIEKVLRQSGYIKSSDKWYAGRPVMITRNDYQTGLFNGDVGITIPSEEDNSKFDVCFMTGNGKIKRIRTYNLPECETVYAMTVHKSQGSEFDSVLFVLPDYDTRVLTRELIYTGITRARNSVDLLVDENILRKGIKRKTLRSTGLRQVLWHPA